MKKFITHLALFAAIFLAVLVTLLLKADKGRIGNHYARFSSPRQYSLICGTSMAAQDISPKVIDALLGGQFMMPIYNYSFAINSSPWGKAYTKSILKKMRPNDEENSLFVFAVDPFSLGNILGDCDGIHRRESNTTVGKMHCVHSSPNIEHLLRYEMKDKQFFKLKNGTGSYIAVDGQTVSTYPSDEDTIIVHDRLYNIVLPDYINNYLPGYSKSDERLSDLSNLIDLCKDSGTVILVRLPLSKELNVIMDTVWPDFDETINSLALGHGVRFINFHNDSTYRTTDGVHLYYDESLKLTKSICDSILSQ